MRGSHRSRPYRRTAALVCLALAAAACGRTADEPASLIDDYLAVWSESFPTQATIAGRHDMDSRLEVLDAETRRRWIACNREAAERAERMLAAGQSAEDAMDLELLARQARRQVFEFAIVRRPERDPLFWTDIAGNAIVFLLVREDRPSAERLRAAVARASALPRLVDHARDALSSADPGSIAAENCTLAADQAEASAVFFREGLPRAAMLESPGLEAEARQAGAGAARALDGFSAFLRELAPRVGGSPRLGEHYAEAFRLGTGIDDPVDDVLDRAERALAAKRAEAAAYGRSVWGQVFPDQPEPADDGALLVRLFDRVAADRAEDVDAFVAQYRALVERSVRFVREHALITLGGPLALRIERSPSYFIGQSVGGVYPAGPFAPEADSLLFVPTPPQSATPAQREAFFRDFNDHFNVMITPHEIVPGHYLQLRQAAHQPHVVRALFPDDLYVEGWGTFCERLMLDLGWGRPLDRVAHLKKQMENIARTIVDIRVHTQGMTREQVLRFVQRDALQDAQFASNMWTRAITSAPQLTTYFLGYEQVYGLYLDVRRARGEAFDLREFMDGMMALGPVPVSHYRDAMLADAGTGSSTIGAP